MLFFYKGAQTTPITIIFRLNETTFTDKTKSKLKTRFQTQKCAAHLLGPRERGESSVETY